VTNYFLKYISFPFSVIRVRSSVIFDSCKKTGLKIHVFREHPLPLSFVTSLEESIFPKDSPLAAWSDCQARFITAVCQGTTPTRVLKRKKRETEKKRKRKRERERESMMDVKSGHSIPRCGSRRESRSGPQM
jgi:hypothetical protein